MAGALADNFVAHEFIYPDSRTIATIAVWTSIDSINDIVIPSYDTIYTPSSMFSMVLASDDITEKFIRLKLNLVLLAYGRLYIRQFKIVTRASTSLTAHGSAKCIKE